MSYMQVLSTESDIDEFLVYYRSFSPNASITPKLHMVEDYMHVVDFIKNWNVGLGMLGEQGAESIHTVFIQLDHTYAKMVMEWTN